MHIHIFNRGGHGQAHKNGPNAVHPVAGKAAGVFLLIEVLEPPVLKTRNQALMIM